MNAAPDFAEPILGWRLWLVVQADDAVRLESVIYDEGWPIKQPLIAACLRGRRSEIADQTRDGIAHVAPVPSCHCGIYAASELELLAPYLDGRYPGKTVVTRVFGVVALWGSVVACERGWRASQAYPALLYVPAGWSSSFERPDELADALGAYGVPVRLLEAGSRATALRKLRRDAAAGRIRVHGTTISARSVRRAPKRSVGPHSHSCQGRPFRVA